MQLFVPRCRRFWKGRVAGYELPRLLQRKFRPAQLPITSKDVTWGTAGKAETMRSAPTELPLPWNSLFHQVKHIAFPPLASMLRDMMRLQLCSPWAQMEALQGFIIELIIIPSLVCLLLSLQDAGHLKLVTLISIIFYATLISSCGKISRTKARELSCPFTKESWFHVWASAAYGQERGDGTDSDAPSH